MVLGIDIDDTMTNSSELITEYAKKYFNSDDINLINNILHGSIIDDKLLTFYHEYLPEMMKKYTLKDNVKEVINRLRSKGHTIIIITARGHSVKKGLMKITRDYLKRHNIAIDKIIFKARDKVNICLENKIDLMIDDSVKVLEDLKNNGINTLLFSTISNKHIKTNIDRVDNWLELEKYIEKLEVNN